MPKKAKNPRSLRTAIRYGWTPVTIKRNERLSYLGMLIQIDRIVNGRRYVARYDNSGGGQLAFEDTQDALMVTLKFG